MIQTPKSDAQGFLIGDPIDIGVALKIWDSIQKDVQAIRKAVTGAAANLAGTKHQPDREQTAAAVALPSGRRGGNTNAASRRTQTPPGRSQHTVAALWNEPRAATKAVAIPAGRDRSGRFVAGNTSIDGGLHDRAPRAGDSAIQGFADSVVSAVNGASAGIEEADPAVKAFQEVAQPMARGYEFLTGGSEDKKQIGLLRRISSTLSGFRNEESAFNKAANKSLKNLEAKPDGGEGGSGGIWGTILSAIMGIGPAVLAGIGTLLSKIPGIGPMFGGGAGAAGGAAKGAGGFFKGALKKIPLLGSLLAVGGAAADIYGSENDDKLTRREKDRNAGKAIGGAGGTIGGMMAGAAVGAFAGPVGMAIGGMVGAFLGDQAGQIIGDKLGGWVNDLRNADIVGSITGAWDGVVSGFKSAYESIGKTWGGFVDSAKAGWDTIANLFTSAYEGLKSIPVIGPAIQAVEDAAKKTAEAASAAAAAVKTKAVEVGTKAVEKVQQGAEYLANNTTVGKGIKATGEAVKYGTDVAVDVAKSAKARITGKASENKAALVREMAASGITDPKEQAMFMAQMDHESGGFTKMEERFNYRSADRLMAVSGSARKLGKPAVEAAMAQGPEAVAEAMYGGRMGNVNPGDAYAFRGRGHIQLTGRDNYAAASKALGMDLENNPDLAADPEVAAKVATWYWKKNPKLGEAARRGDVKGVTQGINGGQNGYGHRNELFAQYSAEASKGSLTASPTSLAAGPTVATLATNPVSFAAPSAPVVASISAPPVSVAPTAPPIAEAPAVAVPMASADTKKASAVAAPAQDAGQDLKDRRIAHIVTGGLSA